jgi:predicted transcriptional regulator of viral defense system
MNNVLFKLAKLPYFRTSHLEALLPNIKRASLYQQITRFLKRGEIIKLKKGFYVFKEFWERNSSDTNYFYFLANILRYPSYVSGVYILQGYDILTDITYPITSITTKTTRKYSNKLGNFTYYSISPKLYIGYQRFLFKNEPIYVASKAKAFFDYLYLKYFKTKVKSDEIIERERLNLENFTNKDSREFSGYCKLSENRILIELNPKLFKKGNR